jgi:hypothetical protein
MVRQLLASLISLVQGGAALAQNEWTSFNVEGGMLTQLTHTQIQPNTGLECRVRMEDRRYKEDWGPSFSVVLSETGDIRRDAQSEHLVQLSMSVAERDGARVYNMRVQGFPEPQQESPTFLALLGESEEIVLRLSWRDDGTFSYFAFEQGRGLGQGRISEPRVRPSVVIVSASGMSGTFRCERYDV